MLEKLQKANEPWIPRGGLIYFEGNDWDITFRGKMVSSKRDPAVTNFCLDLQSGGMLVGGATLDPTTALDAILKPRDKTGLTMIRMGLWQNSCRLFWGMDSVYKGGLEAPGYEHPDPTDATKKYMGYFTFEDSSFKAPKIEFFYTYDKAPFFTYASIGVPSTMYEIARVMLQITPIEYEVVPQQKMAQYFEMEKAGKIRIKRIKSADCFRW